MIEVGGYGFILHHSMDGTKAKDAVTCLRTTVCTQHIPQPMRSRHLVMGTPQNTTCFSNLYPISLNKIGTTLLRDMRPIHQFPVTRCHRHKAERKYAMSEEPKKPKRFQFHLSTAIIVMFMAAYFQWANCRLICKNPYGYGWPLCAVEMDQYKDVTRFKKVNIIGIVLDLGLAGTTLIALGYVCERTISRQAAKKKGQTTH